MQFDLISKFKTQHLVIKINEIIFIVHYLLKGLTFLGKISQVYIASDHKYIICVHRSEMWSSIYSGMNSRENRHTNIRRRINRQS